MSTQSESEDVGGNSTPITGAGSGVGSKAEAAAFNGSLGLGGLNLGEARKVQVAEDAGMVVELSDSTGEKMLYLDEHGDKAPVTMTTVGTYSKTFRHAKRAQTNRMLKNKTTQLTAEGLEEGAITLTARCVREWQGVFDANGGPLECNLANVTAVFTAAPWVLEQIDTAMGNHESFSKANSSD